jgi:hypothetical protein
LRIESHIQKHLPEVKRDVSKHVAVRHSERLNNRVELDGVSFLCSSSWLFKVRGS